MRSINLLSLTVLASVVIAIRCLVIPGIESMSRPEQIRVMGKLMPRARRLLTFSLIFFVASALWQAVVSDTSPQVGTREVVAQVVTILAIVVLVPLTLSPHRSVAMRVDHHRRNLLTIALVLLSSLLVLST